MEGTAQWQLLTVDMVTVMASTTLKNRKQEGQIALTSPSSSFSIAEPKPKPGGQESPRDEQPLRAASRVQTRTEKGKECMDGQRITSTAATGPLCSKCSSLLF